MRAHKVIPELRESDLVRFWDKVCKADGCWVWMGRKLTRYKHGVFTINSEHFLAHRVSAKIAGKLIPSLHVCHTCDNPPCVRPDHLFPGDDQMNMQDCADKKRVGVFSKPDNYQHITGSFSTAEDIRQAIGTQSAIAKQFGVSQSTVSRIKGDLIWVP